MLLLRNYFYCSVKNCKITLYILLVFKLDRPNGVFVTSLGRFPHTLSGWNGKNRLNCCEFLVNVAFTRGGASSVWSNARLIQGQPVVAWFSSIALVSINKGTLHRVQLVLGWVTICWRVNHLSYLWPATQANSAFYPWQDWKWVPAKVWWVKGDMQRFFKKIDEK